MSIIEIIAIITLLAELGNLALLGLLLRIYWGSYKEVRSNFALGLLFFASAFLLKSVITIATLSVFFLLGSPPTGVEPNLTLLTPLPLSAIELVALAFLYRVTRE